MMNLIKRAQGYETETVYFAQLNVCTRSVANKCAIFSADSSPEYIQAQGVCVYTLLLVLWFTCEVTRLKMTYFFSRCP